MPFKFPNRGIGGKDPARLADELRGAAPYIALTEKSTAYPLFQRASAVGCKREQKLLRERAFVSEGRPRLGLRQSLSEKSEWNREFNDPPLEKKRRVLL